MKQTYKNLVIEEKDNHIVIEGIRDFDPVHIFECGQSFRWVKQKDESYDGVAFGKYINVSLQDEKVVLKNTNYEDFVKIWYDYFDLGTDYDKIKEQLRKIDKNLEAAIEFGKGIRILRQELWETLISFIVSANNGIPRIMKIVEILAREYGEPVNTNQGLIDSFTCMIDEKELCKFSFPTAERLYRASIQELDVCKGGFRCKYIYNTARLVCEGHSNLKDLKEMTTFDAREELKKLQGVGPKVADCVLLYSGLKFDVFPTDVWVKRVMEELYFKREASFKEINEFAERSYGDLKGFAQQYLFYYARENKIGS